MMSVRFFDSLPSVCIIIIPLRYLIPNYKLIHIAKTHTKHVFGHPADSTHNQLLIPTGGFKHSHKISTVPSIEACGYTRNREKTRPASGVTRGSGKFFTGTNMPAVLPVIFLRRLYHIR